ncbi:MAG: GNAT family N-acetyltransferase [bacterium]|nr:GNAT family N-acetyltransferase [bacterium]
MCPSTLKQAEALVTAWYVDQYDCALDDMNRPGTVIVADPEREANDSLFLLIRADQVMLRAPAALVPRLRELLATESDDFTVTTSWLRDRLPTHRREVTDAGNLHVYDPARAAAGDLIDKCRRLDGADKEIFDALQAACTEEEREAAEIDIDQPAIFGRFEQDKLTALSALLHFGDTVADVGVLTHPQFRRRGHGREVVAAITAWTLANTERAVIYRYAGDNHASRGVATSLGFHHYARMDLLRTD